MRANSSDHYFAFPLIAFLLGIEPMAGEGIISLKKAFIVAGKDKRMVQQNLSNALRK